MVAPTMGPFTRTETTKGLPTSTGFKPDHGWYSRTWYRQRRPYSLPLDFTYQCGKLVSWVAVSPSDYNHWNQDGFSFPAVNPSTLYAKLYNKAYERFRAKAKGDSASLAMAIATRQQSIDMIEKRLLQLYAIASAIRKKSAQPMNAFGNPQTQPRKRRRPKTGRKKLKDFSQLWLEAHLGWSPLVGDIYGAIDVLQSGVPPARVRSSAFQSVPWNYTTPPNPSYVYTGTEETTWRLGGDVKVTNPALWLANQLGLVNPGAVAWDAIPFSFVVGWFVNVSSVLESVGDWWGVELSNSFTTNAYRLLTTKQQIMHNYPVSGQKTLYYTAKFDRIQVKRTVGPIPGPSLKLTIPDRLSVTRALTASALLLQTLRG